MKEIKRYYSISTYDHIDNSHNEFLINVKNSTFCKFDIVDKLVGKYGDIFILVAETNGIYTQNKFLLESEYEWTSYENSINPLNKKVFINAVKNWELSINRDRKIDEILKNN